MKDLEKILFLPIKDLIDEWIKLEMLKEYSIASHTYVSNIDKLIDSIKLRITGKLYSNQKQLEKQN